jgi:hypothetical protein
MASELGRLYPDTNEYARDVGSVMDSRPLLASDSEATEPKASFPMSIHQLSMTFTALGIDYQI